MKKERNFVTGQVKYYDFKSKQEIADNRMWQTHPSFLNANKKRIVAQC